MRTLLFSYKNLTYALLAREHAKKNRKRFKLLGAERATTNERYTDMIAPPLLTYLLKRILRPSLAAHRYLRCDHARTPSQNAWLQNKRNRPGRCRCVHQWERKHRIPQKQDYTLRRTEPHHRESCKINDTGVNTEPSAHCTEEKSCLPSAEKSVSTRYFD